MLVVKNIATEIPSYTMDFPLDSYDTVALTMKFAKQPRLFAFVLSKAIL